MRIDSLQLLWSKLSVDQEFSRIVPSPKPFVVRNAPLITVGKTVTIGNVRPLTAAMLSVSEFLPFQFGCTHFFAPPFRHSAALHPPTLLSLACALDGLIPSAI